MKYRNSSHNPSGRPIRGSLKPILKTEIEEEFQILNNSGEIVDLHLIEEFREKIKNTAAIYLRYAARTCRAFIQISDESRGIIRNQLSNFGSHFWGFISCGISYYNLYYEDIIVVNLSGPEMASKDPKKAFAQARENSKKIIQKRVEVILQKMRDGVWENITEEFIVQYITIGPAVRFLCDYIAALYIGNLPRTLTREVYADACKLDSHVADHYEPNDKLGFYQLKKQSKHAYTVLKQESATMIFCANYDFNIPTV